MAKFPSLVVVLLTAGVAQAAEPDAAAGRAIALDRAKGNCLACHTRKGGDIPSNVGPELINMMARYPDPKQLYAIVFDEQRRNPQTVMPPFGRHRILTPGEIDNVVAFLETL